MIAVGFLLLYLIFHRWGFFYVGLGVQVAGVISSRLSAWIDWLWTGLSKVLGAVSNTVLLSAVFIFVVTPVGLVRRWRGKDRMLKFDRKATSNFMDRDHVFAGKDLDNTW